ncbi:hypothetical protein [Lysinibacillus sp. fls2-241-R2A-57]|nr:hypothetical protein [Lysinibacillus sp. fls2-241-R2A-57]
MQATVPFKIWTHCLSATAAHVFCSESEATINQGEIYLMSTITLIK